MANIYISPNEENLVKILDQSQDSGTTWGSFGSSRKAGQSFQMGTTGYIERIECYIRDGDGWPGTTFSAAICTVTLEIQTDDGGEPSGTVLATATRTLFNTANTKNARWVKFKFLPDERYSLSSGTTYWIVLSATDVANLGAYDWCYDNGGNPYALGVRAYYQAGAWSTDATDDHKFRIYRLSSFSLTDIGAFLTSLSWSRRANASDSASLELANPFGKFTDEDMTNPSGHNLGDYIELNRGMSITIKIPNGSTTKIIFRGIVTSTPSQSSTGGNTVSIEALGYLELFRKRYIAKRYRDYDYDIITPTMDVTNNPESESRLTYIEDIIDNIIYTQTDLFSNYGVEFYYDRHTNPDILHPIEKDYVFDYKTAFECLQNLAEATAREFYTKEDGTLILQNIADPNDATSSPHPLLSRGTNIVSDSLEQNYDNLRNQIIIEGKNGAVVIEEDIESIEDYGLVPYYEKANDLETEKEIAAYAQLLLKKYTTLNKTGNIQLKEFTDQCVSTIPNSFLDIYPGDLIQVNDKIVGMKDFDNDIGAYYRIESIGFTYDGSLQININIESVKIVPGLTELEIEKNLQQATTGGETSIDMVTVQTAVIKLDNEIDYSYGDTIHSRIARYDSGNYDWPISKHTSKYGP